MEAQLQSYQRQQQPHDPFRKRFIWHSYCRHALLHPHIKHFLYFFSTLTNMLTGNTVTERACYIHPLIHLFIFLVVSTS